MVEEDGPEALSGGRQLLRAAGEASGDDGLCCLQVLQSAGHNDELVGGVAELVVVQQAQHAAAEQRAQHQDDDPVPRLQQGFKWNVPVADWQHLDGRAAGTVQLCLQAQPAAVEVVEEHRDVAPGVLLDECCQRLGELQVRAKDVKGVAVERAAAEEGRGGLVNVKYCQIVTAHQPPELHVSAGAVCPHKGRDVLFRVHQLLCYGNVVVVFSVAVADPAKQLHFVTCEDVCSLVDQVHC